MLGFIQTRQRPRYHRTISTQVTNTHFTWIPFGKKSTFISPTHHNQGHPYGEFESSDGYGIVDQLASGHDYILRIIIIIIVVVVVVVVVIESW
jgi:hypothetical protein